MRSRSAALVLVVGLLAFLAPPAGAAPPPKIEKGLLEKLQAGKADHFVVEFTAEAALGAAEQTNDHAKRGRRVYAALTTTAQRSQARALGLVAGTKGASASSYWLVNEMIVRGGAGLAQRLAALPEVQRVRTEKRYPLIRPVERKAAIAAAASDPEWGVAKIRADQAWEQGVLGSGIVVANVDTGVDYTHEALVNQYRGNLGDGNFDHNYNWWDPTGICGDTPCDNAEHGTHTMGTMVGGDGPGPFEPDIGVAPGARWIAAKGCEDFGCSEEALLSSGQFMVAPTDLDGDNPDPDRRPDIVNNSWGGGPGDQFYLGIVQAWRAAGIFPVFAAGNSGPGCSSGGSPGDYLESFSVGATDDGDDIADFSSRGPSEFGKVMPEVSAPGVDVTSSVPGDGYASFSGTSMATPHTVGTLALVLSAEPALIGDFQAATDAVRATAVDRLDDSCGGDGDGDPNNVYGDGRIDALAAVELVATGGTLSGTVTDDDTGDTIPGARITADDGSREFSATADETGHYQLFLAAGTYTVSAEAFGYHPSVASGVVIVTDENTTQNFALVSLPRFDVTGHITREDGSPIDDARVKAIGTPVPAASTDADGFYSLRLPIGEYTLRASAGGCAEIAFADVAVVDQDIVQDFLLTGKLDDFGHGCGPIAFDWVDAQNETAMFGDETVGRLALPFAFPFYGENASQVYISSNGFLSFEEIDPFGFFYEPSPIPSTSEPNAAVYPLWQDLIIDASSAVQYATVGDAPDRAFVIEFSNVKVFGGSDRGDFEVKLWEKGTIDFLYGASIGGNRAKAIDGGDALIGIENHAGTDAFQFSFREDLLEANSAFRFELVPSGVATGTITDANDAQPISGATVTATPGGRSVTTGEDGVYRLRLLPATYSLTASAENYVAETEAGVAIVNGGEAVTDFSLEAPVADLSTDSISKEVDYGAEITTTLQVGNNGSAPLHWEMRERDEGVTEPDLPPAPDFIRPAGWRKVRVPRGAKLAETRALPPDALLEIISDPPGDAVGPIDITSVRGGSDSTDASVAIDFTGDTPADQAVGYVMFDTDQDPGTGIPPEFLAGKPTQDIGVDYFADLFALPDEGVVLIWDSNFEFVAEVPGFVEGQTVRFDVPLEAFGGDDGSMDVDLVIGDFFQPHDWAPDAGHGTIEPFVDAPWMSVAPESGTTLPGRRSTVTVHLGAEDLSPGTYQGQLVLLSDAPKQPSLTVDVTLEVLMPDEFGAVKGTVLDAHTGEPLRADVTIHAEWHGALDITTRAAEDGTYKLLAPEGTWSMDFDLDGFVSASREVTVVRGVTTEGVDGELHRMQPHAALDAGALDFVLTEGGQRSGHITLSNPGGHTNLEYETGEGQFGGGGGGGGGGGVEPSRRAAGKGKWLSRSTRGVEMRRNGGGKGLAHPSSFRWTAARPSQDLNILVYADDVVHFPPDSLVDLALQGLGLSYTAYYDGDWGGFESALEDGGWDLVLVANDNWAPDTSVFDALHTYVEGGGMLVFHGWTVGDEPSHPLWEAMGFQFVGDDNDPPDSVYWWQPGHPAFNIPQFVPEFTSLDGDLYGVYGQHVEPVGGGEALAGYTTPGPDPDEAALILGPTRTTVFRGFLDGQNSADLDDDGTPDGTELWSNLILGIQTGFLTDVPWLTVTPESGTVGPDGSAEIEITVDATGMDPGVYEAAALVLTNDPDNRAMFVPVMLLVTDYMQGVNAGGRAYTALDGTSYSADRAFGAGGFGYAGSSQVARTTRGIRSTEDDPLYRDLRRGMGGYRFTVPNGMYRVTLRFAELASVGEFDRVMDIKAEGQLMINNLDVFGAAPGRRRALDQTFEVQVTDGRLDVRFIRAHGLKPIVNALLVVRVPVAEEPPAEG